MPAPVHADPEPTHIPATQQPPASQLLAAQQGRPAVPHVVAPAPAAPEVVPVVPPVAPPPLLLQPRTSINAAVPTAASDERADDDLFRFIAAPKIE